MNSKTENTILRLLSSQHHGEEATVEELMEITEKYPAFGVAKYLLSKKMRQQQPDSALKYAQNAVLYFHDPFWFHFKLNEEWLMVDDPFAAKKGHPEIPAAERPQVVQENQPEPEGVAETEQQETKHEEFLAEHTSPTEAQTAIVAQEPPVTLEASEEPALQNDVEAAATTPEPTEASPQLLHPGETMPPAQQIEQPQEQTTEITAAEQTPEQTEINKGEALPAAEEISTVGEPEVAEKAEEHQLDEATETPAEVHAEEPATEEAPPPQPVEETAPEALPGQPKQEIVAAAEEPRPAPETETVAEVLETPETEAAETEPVAQTTGQAEQEPLKEEAGEAEAQIAPAAQEELVVNNTAAVETPTEQEAAPSVAKQEIEAPTGEEKAETPPAAEEQLVTAAEKKATGEPADEYGEVFEEEDPEPNDADLPPIGGRIAAVLQEQLADFKKPVVPETPVPIETEPYHTIDYFASQGIKLTPDQQSKDHISVKVKKFTDWLKQMKRINPTPADLGIDEAAVNKVQHIAADSNEPKEVVTETMAEVYAKQGMTDKAIQVYIKLSFLYPSKSAYFAAQIEHLKGI